MNKTIQKRKKADQNLLLEQLKKTPIVQFACEKSGIGRATYYRWRKEDHSFAEMADQALQESVSLINDLAESQLLSSIRDKNMTAIIFWLKYRHKSYSNKLELSGEIKTSIGGLTPEQQELLEKAIGLMLPKLEAHEDHL
ncbi:hypothetical protein C4561_02855 [candidate division WWE3 bacterium]|uniref:Uncharacterized protein n=1 Tax=candidate division WWE3 bacterium TaxID=2053526 RepID=A0A3A4ZDR2_UNCKA|nr:MAG: hypothetical protein C4561_02855 [candidate division WWE3 bacterium]